MRLLSKLQWLKLFVFCAVIAMTFANRVFAVVRLPNIIGSNMVLQQKSDAVLWGWANPGEKVVVTTSWNMKKDSVIGDRDARWKIKIPTPQAGGPHTITLKGSNTIVLENILVGEVWVCSGQSNMEWSSNQKVQQILDEMPNSNNSQLRLFHVPKSTSKFPQDNIEGNWKMSGPQSVEGFSAIGYFFAKELQQKLNVPIGIVNSSWGGTPAEVWTPEGLVTGDPELLAAAGKQAPTSGWPFSPGYAYNSMIHPITHFPIAGVIWYQGESNVSTAASYTKLFSAMIDSWRSAWRKQFPFYFVEIAPFAYGNQNTAALLREAQSNTLRVPNTGMVVITDLVDNIKDIHPKNKKDVGLRLAKYALGETYGQNAGVYKSPSFNRMEIAGNNMNLYFENAPTGFKTSDGQSPTEFYIAGSDKVFVPASVKIEKNRLVVSNYQVKTPVAVRFAFSNEAMPNVFSTEGLPVAPFRTDDWEVNTGLK